MSALEIVQDAITQAYKAYQQEEVKNTNVRQELQDLMSASKRIPCTYYECPGMRSDGTSSNNVKYATVRRGERLHCDACRRAFRCTFCNELCHLEDKACGLYRNVCIDCTRCEYCRTPMWDYVCKCEV